ncbi:DUF2397 domain-containing protein [Leifsonia sp. Leaf264]|uniref:DUF2397 domain-containing protein n=1 Tax=Leifsonia sp. Leaf264 TaxID=1736314 RepID=UPI0006F53148|nr:DUF2397 domain-containing protein [Leifsonia sp. Leaf264]KQO98339.1 hypothetical protein ASF30_09775 [Leifsonia sp. Leaf264]
MARNDPADGPTAPPRAELSTDARQARRQLFAYLTAEHADVYGAIMRALGGDVLAREMSATEITDALRADYDVDEAFVDVRLVQLVEWGNVIPGVRNPRVSTISEILRSRGRYQVSKLGARVARDSDEILAAADGAREVARELLGVISDQLAALLESFRDGRDPDTGEIAAAVTSVFNNHRVFHSSLRDFYGYLNTVITRFDLVGDDYMDLKTILMGYVDLIGADVRRNWPAIHRTLAELEPHFDLIIDKLNAWQTLTDENIERAAGRSRVEWEELSRWYNGEEETSGPASLRNATDQALNQLIVNARRIISNAGSGVSRRGDLLRLAVQFDSAEPEDAHTLFADSFGLYSWRHLLYGETQTVQPIASTSWLNAPPVDIAVSLRERGDRSARGRTSPIPDTDMYDQLTMKEAEEKESRRRMAAAELIAAGTLDNVKLSAAAEAMFLHALTQMAIGTAGEETFDFLETGISVHRGAVDGVTTILLDGGSLTIEGFLFTVTAYRMGAALTEQAVNA